MIRILYILLSLLPFVSLGQYDSTWTRTYGGFGEDICKDMISTKDGGMMLIGSTSSFDLDNSQMYFLKLDSLGEIQWSRTYGGFNIDWGNSIIQTSDNGFLAAGYTNSYGHGGYDAYFVKLDSIGNYEWEAVIGSSDWDFASDVIEYSNNEFIACGKTYNTSNGVQAGWLFKFTAGNSDSDWEVVYPNTNETDFNSLTIAPLDNSIMVVGYSTIDNEGKEILIARYSGSGQFKLEKLFGDGQDDALEEIINISDSSFLVTGSITDTINGNSDIFTAEIDTTGDTLWLERWTNINGTGKKIIERPDGNPAVLGEIYYGASNSDLFYIFMGYNGNGTYGSGGIEQAAGLIYQPNGRYVFAGNTNGYDAYFNDIIIYYTDSIGGIDDINSYSFYEDINVVSSTNSIDQSLDLSIYPNPTNGVLSISSSTHTKIEQIDVFDLTGKKVLMQRIPDQHLSLESLPSGVYYVRLQTEKKSFSKKIVLSR